MYELLLIILCTITVQTKDEKAFLVLEVCLKIWMHIKHGDCECKFFDIPNQT